MDIETLKQLGVNVEDLQEKIIERAVRVILSGIRYDEDEEHEWTIVEGIKKDVEKRVKEAVDAKISKIAEEHVTPKVGEMIDKITLQESNGWGEPKGPALSFREYIVARAEAYMSEGVDSSGKSQKEADRYSWKQEGPRLLVLMKNYIYDTLNKAASNAVTDVNKVIAKNIANAAQAAIEAAGKDLSVKIGK
jgi:hypothetical protein